MLRSKSQTLGFLLALMPLLGCAHAAHAGGETELHYATVTAPGGAPAIHYARMDRATCEAELTRRKISWVRANEMQGIMAPVRLIGALHGVQIHSMLPAKERATSAYEVYDCRLLLAVDDFSIVMAQAGVTEVVHYSVYRPPGKGAQKKKHSQHEGALAIDIAKFIRHDGTVLSVEKDFHGRVGSTTCPLGNNQGPNPSSEDSLVLWRMFCTASDAKLFNVALSPNFNKPHYNHFHLEVTPDVTWFITH